MKEFGNGYTITYMISGNYRLSNKMMDIVILTSEDIDEIYKYKKDVEDGPNVQKMP